MILKLKEEVELWCRECERANLSRAEKEEKLQRKEKKISSGKVEEHEC